MKHHCLIPLFLILSCSHATPNVSCSKEMAKSAEDEIMNVRDWGHLEDFFIKYESCDDGLIGEGVSDRVGYLMAKNFQDFLRYVDNDTRGAFVSFVLDHIDESQSELDLQATAQQSRNCLDTVALCKAINFRAESALDNL